MIGPDEDTDHSSDELDDDDDNTCPVCFGFGMDPTGLMPCECCDGYGFKWWVP